MRTPAQMTHVFVSPGQGHALQLVWHPLESKYYQVSEDGIAIRPFAHIVEKNGEYILYSKDGSKKLGTYKTRKEAEEREKQVEFFKHEGK